MKSVSAFFTLVLLISFTSLSTAQTDWTKYEGNPVLEKGPAGAWDDDNVSDPCVIKVGETYHMWYDGNWDNPGSRNIGIGHATSSDGIEWSKDGLNPVLLPTAGSWDLAGVAQATVLFDDMSSLFHMWYGGWSALDNGFIGHATSSDGGYWIKDTINNPVLSPGPSGSWDDFILVSVCVIQVDGTYHMWYDGWEDGSISTLKRIGHATSADGITWEKDANNPVLIPGSSGSWDRNWVRAGEVVFDGSKFHMFYTGGTWFHYDIGYAYSEDGSIWTKYNNPGTTNAPYSESDPVLKKGLAGQWDSWSLVRGSVMLNESKDAFKMWYTGSDNDFINCRIGYATAPLNLNVPGDFETIQAAIDAAHDGDVVLVNEGTYYENINFKGKAITVASRFYMDDDISHISKTIIDGSQPANPDSGSVVYFISGEDTTSVLMGFTITNGTGTKIQYTFESDIYDARAGGGIACWYSGGRFVSNKIINNTITDDSQSLGGGFGAGDFGSDAWVILEKNQIMNNTLNGANGASGGGVIMTCNGRLVNNVISYNSCIATEYEATGGGVRITTESKWPRTVIIKGNQITHNFLNAIGNGGAYGAGISMNQANNGSLISGNLISDNTIAENIASGGGGISLRSCDVSIPIINNIIAGNSAMNGGGIYLYNSKSEIINNTIVKNSVVLNGGGLRAEASNPVVINTILWANEASNGPQILGNAQVFYSDIQGGRAGEGNRDIDPQFVANDSLYHLMDTGDTSMCLNTGITSIEINNTTYQAPLTDYYGNLRPQPPGTPPDMGAWESDVLNALENIKGSKIPLTFTLKQNYPNPFNPLTTIEFSIPQAEFVSLKIYNLLGQQVLILVSEKLRAGNYKYTWHASGFASGIYYYQLTAGGFQDLKKMVLLR